MQSKRIVDGDSPVTSTLDAAGSENRRVTGGGTTVVGKGTHPRCQPSARRQKLNEVIATQYHQTNQPDLPNVTR